MFQITLINGTFHSAYFFTLAISIILCKICIFLSLSPGPESESFALNHWPSPPPPALPSFFKGFPRIGLISFLCSFHPARQQKRRLSVLSLPCRVRISHPPPRSLSSFSVLRIRRGPLSIITISKGLSIIYRFLPCISVHRPALILITLPLLIIIPWKGRLLFCARLKSDRFFLPLHRSVRTNWLKSRRWGWWDRKSPFFVSTKRTIPLKDLVTVLFSFLAITSVLGEGIKLLERPVKWGSHEIWKKKFSNHTNIFYWNL